MKRTRKAKEKALHINYPQEPSDNQDSSGPKLNLHDN